MNVHFFLERDERDKKNKMILRLLPPTSQNGSEPVAAAAAAASSARVSWSAATSLAEECLSPERQKIVNVSNSRVGSIEPIGRLLQESRD